MLFFWKLVFGSPLLSHDSCCIHDGVLSCQALHPTAKQRFRTANRNTGYQSPGELAVTQNISSNENDSLSGSATQYIIAVGTNWTSTQSWPSQLLYCSQAAVAMAPD